MALKTLTIALVCGTAQAGYSISSMLTTRMAWLAAAVFTLSCKYFYEAIMAEDDDEDHGKRE